jgi:S1-C subfamily serine protease
LRGRTRGWSALRNGPDAARTKDVQPKPEAYDYDLDEALSAVVGVRALIPPDGYTAETLGTERLGHGAIIRSDGIVLTIGYLVTEAETVWLSLADGKVVQGHVLAYDQATGFGLVQALARIDAHALELGSSAAARTGQSVVVAGFGGRHNAVAARIISKQEFAGYWEYLLDDAIFTAPAHPHWGGSAMIGPDGRLIGIGSLQVQQMREGGVAQDINMIVPIDILKPILDDMLTMGRVNRPPRPWLGMFATEVGGRIAVAGLSKRSPAQRSELRMGDIILAVAGHETRTLAEFFRRLWSLGEAGVEVPLQINRNGQTREIVVKSGDRNRFLKRPIMH